MRNRFVSALVVGFMLLVMLPVAWISNTPAVEPARAEPVVSCTDVTIGQQVRIKCTAAGIVVLNTTINLPVIEIPIPGPTSTETVRVTLPGETRTVKVPVEVPVPGPTSTVTKTVTITVPGDTKTIKSTATATTTSRPETVTQTQTQGPGSPRTETVTVSPSGQPSTPDAIVVSPPDKGGDNPVEELPIFNGIDTPGEVVGISTLTLLLLVGLLLLGSWLGYYFGYKDADRENANFMKALSDKALIRGEHR